MARSHNNHEEIKNQILKFLRQHQDESNTFQVFLAIKSSEITYDRVRLCCKELEDHGYLTSSEALHDLKHQLLVYPISITDKGKDFGESGGGMSDGARRQSWFSRLFGRS